jgi:sugar lactone lactonase YvrE
VHPTIRTVLTLEAELVVDCHDVVGEGPLWDERASVLWWTDLLGRRVHQLDPAKGQHTIHEVEQEVGALVPRASGGFMAAVRDGFASWDPAAGLTMLAPVEADRPDLRMNDGKCDRRGRFWAASMAFDCSPAAGSLYVLEPDGSTRRVLTGLTIGNGLAWTSDDATMYYIDSTRQCVEAFDFDLDKGILGNARRVIEVAPADDPASWRLPDGMCIDQEGFLWVAIYGAGVVCRYRPDGTLHTTIELPVSQVTCPVFGGEDLRDLYITTAAQEMSADDLDREPHAGALFRVRTDVPGTAPFAFAG